MMCKNCAKEIGTQKECSFCGYNPECDATGIKKARYTVKLPETKINLLKTKNGLAGGALAMSILSFIPIPFMLLAFIFNIKASLRCSSYRDGTGKCVAAWIFFFLWVLLYAYIILSITGELGSF